MDSNHELSVASVITMSLSLFLKEKVKIGPGNVTCHFWLRSKG